MSVLPALLGGVTFPFSIRVICVRVSGGFCVSKLTSSTQLKSHPTIVFFGSCLFSFSVL